MRHLARSLLGMTSLAPLEILKQHSPSAILANLLYLMFLVVGVILLINLMIALLSNTYQKVQVIVELETSPLVFCNSFEVRNSAEIYLNPLHRKISIHILRTVPSTFHMVTTRRICVTIKSFLIW